MKSVIRYEGTYVKSTQVKICAPTAPSDRPYMAVEYHSNTCNDSSKSMVSECFQSNWAEYKLFIYLSLTCVSNVY